jgi:hypothetical protein
MPQSATACPPALDWQKFSRSTVSYRSVGNPAGIELVIYVDGLYAKNGVKETYQLKNGLALFRGLEEKDWAPPGPFFMFEMPAFFPARLVAEQFPDPCTIPADRTEFEFVMPPGNAMGIRETHAFGAASRKGALVNYEVRARDIGDQRVVIEALGLLDLGPRASVPRQMPIAGWDVAEPAAEPMRWVRVPATANVKTIADLYALKPERK